jgi:hypothetical protein
MKLKHKALVRIVYPQAYCARVSGDEESGTVFNVYDKRPVGRLLGVAHSAWGAWADAYSKFSTHLKRKAQRLYGKT